MALKPTRRSDTNEQQGSNYAGAVIGGASSVEKGTRQDEVEVNDGCQNYVKKVAELDLDLVKEDDGNRGRDLKMTTTQQFGDTSILKGECQAPLELECRRMVSTADQLVVVDSEDLPEEVVLILFKFMKPKGILSASQVCQLWRNVGENDNLWQQKCKEADLAFSLTPAKKKALERCNESSPIAYSAWKESFLKPYKISRKFREGVPQVITIEMSHGVNNMEFYNDKIVTTFGTNLYVFCAWSGNLLHELVGHTKYVAGVQMNDQFIVSGSHDGSMKVWDVDTGFCFHTMLGHTAGVTFLQMHGGIAVSGSCNTNALRVWVVRDGRCRRTLRHYNDSRHRINDSLRELNNRVGREIPLMPEDNEMLLHVQFDGRFVVSASEDKTIKVWNPETGDCLRTLSHNSYIRCLKFNGVDVAACYSDGSIKVWDVNTGVSRSTLRSKSQYMEMQGDTLVCEGDDRTTAKIWNMSTGACLHTLNEHRRAISGIAVNDKLVVTSSRDGTVKLWDLKTGEFIRNMLVLESGGTVEKMKMEDAKIVCSVKSNEALKLLVLNFDTNDSD